MNSRILPVLALLVAILIFFGYVNPTWGGSIAAQNAAIDSDNRALQAASDYTARQNELASERNAIDPNALARLGVFLPDSVDNVRLILDLNSLAARSGLALTSIDVANSDKASSSGPSAASAVSAVSATGESPVGSVDLSLAANGSYAALQTFLAGVESSARLLDVTDLTVKGSDTGVYTYQMTIRLYWLR